MSHVKDEIDREVEAYLTREARQRRIEAREDAFFFVFSAIGTLFVIGAIYYIGALLGYEFGGKR